MDTMGFKRIGKYLREKRENKNLTQANVATELGLSSAQFISNFERGLCTPSWKILAALLPMYDIPKREIIDLLMEEQERWIRTKLAAPAKTKTSRRA